MKDKLGTIEERYDRLFFSDYIVVDNTRTRLAIDDLSSLSAESPEAIVEQIDNLILASRGKLKVYKDTDLMSSLNPLISPVVSGGAENTILIFPGNGGQNVKRLLGAETLNRFANIDVRTDRTLSGSQVQSVRLLNEKTKIRSAFTRRIDTCAVFDDVVLTGKTMEALKENIDPKNYYTWLSFSLMQLTPYRQPGRQMSRSGLEGFEKSFSAVLYEGQSGIPSNFSLSTLIGNSPKSLSVREKYKENYVEDRQLFDSAVMSLRELFK